MMGDIFVEKYQKLARLAEGSYGKVLKCRDKSSGRVVAIKKFKESEDDPQIRKIALREVKMLMMLKHPNLVGLIEIFRRRRRLHLVFEFIDHTALNELEAHPQGLPLDSVKRITFQVLRGIEFCHSKNVVHRDVKPENVLVTTKYVVKMCDFGFARTLEGPNAIYTDYVATRWYRATELLVGDTSYDSTVDVWAIGCLFCEMLTGRPLWPGESDIDQVDKIIHTLGPMVKRHEFVFDTNSFFAKVKRPTLKTHDRVISLRERFSRFGRTAIDFMEKAIVQDPAERVSCSELLAHNFFIEGGFVESFLPELRELLDEPPLTIDPPAASSRVGPTTRAPTHKPRSPSPHIISPTPMSTSPVAAAKHKGPTTGFTKPGGSSTFGGSFKSTNGFGQARAPGFVASVSTSPSPKKPSGGTLSSTKPTRNAPRFRTLPTAAQKSPGVFSKKPGGVGQGGAIVRGVKASSLKTFRGSDKKKFLPSLGP